MLGVGLSSFSLSCPVLLLFGVLHRTNAGRAGADRGRHDDQQVLPAPGQGRAPGDAGGGRPGHLFPGGFGGRAGKRAGVSVSW